MILAHMTSLNLETKGHIICINEKFASRRGKKNSITYLSSLFISFSFLVVLQYSFSRSGMIIGTLSINLASAKF